MSWILSAFRVTSPEVTVKSVPSKVATPGLVSVANSAEIVRVSVELTTALIPSPAVNVIVFPLATVSELVPSLISNPLNPDV